MKIVQPTTRHSFGSRPSSNDSCSSKQGVGGMTCSLQEHYGMNMDHDTTTATTNSDTTPKVFRAPVSETPCSSTSSGNSSSNNHAEMLHLPTATSQSEMQQDHHHSDNELADDSSKILNEKTESFIKLARNIMNETKRMVVLIMRGLDRVRELEKQVKRFQESSQSLLTDSRQEERVFQQLHEKEVEVKQALCLCSKSLGALVFLNMDENIRRLFMQDQIRPQFVKLLLYILSKLVGSQGLEIKVDPTDQAGIHPRIILQDVCRLLSLFAKQPAFVTECSKSASCNTVRLLQATFTTVRGLHLLTHTELEAVATLPGSVQGVQNAARLSPTPVPPTHRMNEVKKARSVDVAVSHQIDEYEEELDH